VPLASAVAPPLSVAPPSGIPVPTPAGEQACCWAAQLEDTHPWQSPPELQMLAQLEETHDSKVWNASWATLVPCAWQLLTHAWSPHASAQASRVAQLSVPLPVGPGASAAIFSQIPCWQL
jgi:hypothetical protein